MDSAPSEAAMLSTEVLTVTSSANGATAGCEVILDSTNRNALGNSNKNVSSQAEMIYGADNKIAAEKSLYDRNEDYADAEIDDHDDEPVTVLDMLWTWFLPLMFLWFRRSMFGTANLFRSVLLGQCIRLLLTTATGTVDPLPKWALMVSDPHAWPPPALTGLAFLTIVAFVVHPDGLTWFMLGKLRDAILSLLHSIASCWTIFIQDYGIITTTIALMTLAGIGCLLGILLKNALPKSASRNNNHNSRRSQAAAQEKKKKKRKGGVKGKGGRLRTFRKSEPEFKPIDEDSSSSHELTTTKGADETLIKEAASHPETVHFLETEAHSPTDNVPPLRPRMQSASTLDTIGDDGSCDSISVQSSVSMPSAVTVISTANPESGKSTKKNTRNDSSSSSSHSSKNSRGKNQRLQQLKGNNVALGGVKGKVGAVDVRLPASSTSSRQTEGPKAVSSNGQHRSHNGAHPPSTQVGKQQPAITGRFAHLKEKDTRFDNPRRTTTRLTSGKGKIISQGGRGHSNSLAQSSDPFLSANIPGKQSNDIHSQAPPVVVAPQINSESNKYFGSSVQFYSLDGSQSTRKKLELSAFLATVGILGDDAAALIANVPDIDCLECLSHTQFLLYGVNAEKQAHIGQLLEQRRHGRLFQNQIRPPPGLSPIHDEPPTLFGGSPHRSGAPPPMNLTSQLSSIPTTRYLSSHPFAYDETQYSGMLDDEESRIEAELQELGGKMIGSVLDF